MVVKAPVEVGIVAMSQSPSHREFNNSEPALIMECVNDVLGQVDIDRHDIDFTIAGSCDYLSGMPFAFVMNIDAVGAWPPVYENHVEMDGAWALFEAWVRLQLGDISSVLVSGSGKSSPGSPRDVFPLQTDPYYVAPLGFDTVTAAGLQANALIHSGKASEEDFAEIVSRSRKAAMDNPNAQIANDISPEELLKEPYFSAPLRMHDLSPISDGAAAMIIATKEKALELCDNPVWIKGIDHRMETHRIELRDLTQSPSAKQAATEAGAGEAQMDIAELSVNYSPEEIILKEAMGIDDSVKVNLSGGPLAGNPVMATGLIRVIEVAKRIQEGSAGRGLAHASSGGCLQQNLVCVLEGGK